MNRQSFRAYLNDKKKTPGFRKGYERERENLRLGYRIFLMREKTGMTQGELARRIGTRQSNVSRMERGEYNFTVSMLEKIVEALNARLRIEITASPSRKAA